MFPELTPDDLKQIIQNHNDRRIKELEKAVGKKQQIELQKNSLQHEEHLAHIRRLIEELKVGQKHLRDKVAYLMSDRQMLPPENDTLRLLKDIQEELGRAYNAAQEENDQSGPWLPVGLCVRINDEIERREKECKP